MYKVTVGFSRVFVGVLFLISGLIKLNDPVGFSFKLQDYFAPDVLNLEFLVPYALLMAIILVLIEVLLGVMLLVGYATQLTLWSLLSMIVFFTFLTFYSAYFEKVTDCGCFGDALKLTHWQSFSKDLVLLVLIAFLLWKKDMIQSWGTPNVRSIIVLMATVLSLAFGYQVLMHLPVVDFRPYKIGVNITNAMQTPSDAPAPIIEYRWQYEGPDGPFELVNTTGQDPQPEGAQRTGVETQFLRPPYEPPIHDFSMERDGMDYTQELLEEPKLIVVVAYNLAVSEMNGFATINTVVAEAQAKGYKVIGLSASGPDEVAVLREKFGVMFDFYFCDMTALKTIVRSNPAVMEWQSGMIKQKLHWNDALKLKFN